MTDILTKDLANIVGLDTLPEDEKIALIRDMGDVVMEAALLRFTAELSAKQMSALEHYLETEPDSDALLQHLLEHHPQFEKFLTEESAAFREEAVRIMGNV